MKYDAVYQANHKRVRKERGDAFSYRCVDCGSWAHAWSQRHHSDPSDIGSYDPRCHRCHYSYDHREEGRVDALFDEAFSAPRRARSMSLRPER